MLTQWKSVPIPALLVGLVAAGVGGLGVPALAGDQPAKDAASLIVRSARSGPWSAPATWEGNKLPAAGARVQVRTGHTVIYDLKSDQVIRSVHVAGTLTLARDRDTRLDVGLIKIQPGDDASEDGFNCDAHATEPAPGTPQPALEAGTPEKPMPAQHTALIRLTYVHGLDKQSCPAIVCCGGRMDFHGTPLNRTWVKLRHTARQGDKQVTLAEPVSGWKVGDRVIVTQTADLYGAGKKHTTETEERIIRAIDGARLTFSAPLEFEHQAEGFTHGEVANLTRNVIVESANAQAERGHTMYHKHSAGAISYAEFRHLGKPGVLGRYPLHYHLVGDTMRGSYVIGTSIWGSANRWLTIHGTNYLVVRDNVGYQGLGHGFYFEDGTEVYNVLDRNLAVGARRTKPLPKQALGFDSNRGAGFWWANSLNTFTRNVAADNDEYGFWYESLQPLVLPVQQPDGSRKKVDIRTLPFVRFDDNEIHSNFNFGGMELSIDGTDDDSVGPDARHPFIIRNLLIWNTHYGMNYKLPSLAMDGLRLHNVVYGIRGIENGNNHAYRNITIRGNRGGVGLFGVATNRGLGKRTIRLTVDGLTYEGIRGEAYDAPLIMVVDERSTPGNFAHFRNVNHDDRIGNSPRALAWVGRYERVDQRRSPRFQEAGGLQVMPLYFHDYYGPGRHAKVVAPYSKDYASDRGSYRTEDPLTTRDDWQEFYTGTRVAEVKDVEFPNLLDPVDDLPPTTVITQVRREELKVIVGGTTADNGTVKKVLVNGREAKALAANFAQWEVVLNDIKFGELKLSAHAEDTAGNIEKRPHLRRVLVPRSSSPELSGLSPARTK
jgi:hypothetical protein